LEAKPLETAAVVLKPANESGFQPSLACYIQFPGALPQAGMGRAFGASKTQFYRSLSAKGAMPYQPKAKP
jgi:hypothetical protein